MKETGLIFCGESVQGILDGRKTQTRRIIKPQPELDPDGTKYSKSGYWWRSTLCQSMVTIEQAASLSPYGVVGDLLRVKETWRCTGGGDLRNIIYRAEGDSPLSFCGIDDGRAGILHVPEPHWAEWDRLVYKTNKGCNWRSPLFMPKWAVRLWLKKTSNRAPERVQEISPKDAMLEGIKTQVHLKKAGKFRYGIGDIWSTKNAPDAFRKLWDSLNARPKKTKHNPYTGAREDCYVGYPWEDIRKEKKLRCGLMEYIVGNPFVWPIEFKRIEVHKQGLI